MLTLRVTLLDAEPPTWREIRVPDDLTFARLHAVLQAAMGWEDYHMHEFEVGGKCVGRPAPKDFFPDDRPVRDERKTRLCDLLGQHRKFRYWYDFGDDWWHEITVVRTTAGDVGRPGLLAGAGARK